MGEKRAQVEHLLEVLGLQVAPSRLAQHRRPFGRSLNSRTSQCLLFSEHVDVCRCRVVPIPTSATCFRAASAAGRQSAPTLA